MTVHVLVILENLDLGVRIIYLPARQRLMSGCLFVPLSVGLIPLFVLGIQLGQSL